MDKGLISGFRDIVGSNYCLYDIHDLYAYSYDSTPLFHAMPDLV